MRRHRLFPRIFAQLLIIMVLLSSFVAPAAASAAVSGSNRYNVVVVLDASGSMLSTDPKGYRFRAIAQFVNLMAEQGNTLGSVVFHTDVAAEQPVTQTTGQADKDAAIQALESVPAGGWTNIGAGLSKAVSMLEEGGDPKLPSVILLLSDGSSAMGSDEETQASLDVKAEALQAAREKDIAIYSVCLNADRTADIAEMEKISDATGGEFMEVSEAEDLHTVFNTFYEMMYGTIPLVIDDVLPASGVLETNFDIPGLGVEEVNIIVYGSPSRLTLVRPDGSEGKAAVNTFDTFTMMKLTDIIPGTWTLVTEGVPGDSVKINMMYNTNLGIELSVAGGQTFAPGDKVTITARLTGNGIPASNSQQYTGYSAQLLIMDAYGDYVETVPMQVVNDHFEASRTFAEGIYYCKVAVTGNQIEKESESVGPLTCAENGVGEDIEENTPPVPVKDVVEATVNIWPVKGGSYTLDLKTLATDAEDSELRYKITSSSFMDGIDYDVDPDSILRMDHFSLSKGGFTVQATDSGGLSCEIEVVVRTVNITVLALISLGAAVLVGVTVFLILLRIALSKPFRGTISAQSYCNGMFRGTPRQPKRGRCKLSVFGMDDVGLDYQKCYFQASGQNYIELVTNVPIIWNGQETKKVRITSGAQVTITIRRDDPRLLYVRFDSRIPPSRAPRGPKPGPKRPPKPGPGSKRPPSPGPMPGPGSAPGGSTGWR